ncbi:hypothetical protein AB1Y20_002637 [Prymnesium parvum]|uniref:15-cis-phytoene synthase n=1 Tax=Prymnesium parvum TaxID=97485 RepID=A0AB34JBZ1_PRYPA
MAALALISVPKPCGSWQPRILAAHMTYARHSAPCAALQTNDGSELLTDSERQAEQIRSALQSLLPSYRQSRERPSLDDQNVPEALAAGTLSAIIASKDDEALARREKLLQHSYEQCRQITAQYAKTFYFGTSFFSEEKRKAVWAVYAWCRRTDDIVDKPRKETVSLRTELAEWKRRTEDIWRGIAHDSIDLALVDTIRQYPNLSIQPFDDMIKGMVMDLDQNRFETFDELYLYCYRVAGTVGLMTMPIMGTAPDSTYLEALEPALALGVALQLTNILRDVGEDRVRQRIYIPQEDLRRFGVTEASLLKGIKDEKYVALLKFQIARARKWYKVAEDGIPMLAEDARLPVRASLDMYSSILDKIEANNYDNFNKRAYTSKFEKLMMLPKSYIKVKTGY